MKKDFLIVAGYTLFLYVLSLLLGNISKWLKFLILVGIAFPVFFVFRKRLKRYEFASITFLELAIFVAISTFQAHSKFYGTLWFNGILVLFLLSIIACVLNLKPKKTLMYASYITFHGGLLVAALGFIVNALGGKKYYYPLHIGETSSIANVVKNIEITDSVVATPVKLTLLDFKVSYYRYY